MLRVTRLARLNPWFWLAISLLTCFGVWYWAAHILVPVNTVAAQSQGRPVGNNSDLYPRWLGTRAVLLQRRDPYSAEVTAEIQQGYYGRSLRKTNPSDPTDENAFAYPLYVVFLLAPFANLPFAVVQEGSRWILLACVALTVPIWMAAAGVRAKYATVLTVMLLTVSSYPAVMIFYKQQLTALVLLFMAGAAVAARRGWLSLSAMLLALATVKPQLSFLVIAWFLLWAASEWNHRKRFILSFAAYLGLLVVAAELVLPGWIPRFVAAAREYQRYAADPSLLQVVFTHGVGTAIALLLLGWVSVICWNQRTCNANSGDFASALAAIATVTLVILPKLAPYNQLLLVPALTVIFAPGRISGARSRARALAKGLCACQIWQWATALALSLASLAIGVARLRNIVTVPLYTLYAVPLLTLATLVMTIPAVQRSPRIIPEASAAPRG